MSPEELRDTDWGLLMNCRDDPDMFFPETAAETVDAIWACGNCAVRNICLDNLIENINVPVKGEVQAALKDRDIMYVRSLLPKGTGVARAEARKRQDGNMAGAKQEMDKRIRRAKRLITEDAA